MARSVVIKMKRYVESIRSNSRQVVVLVGLLLLVSGSAGAASKHIAVLVWDGVLTSDVTAPIEVFGAASRKAWFSSYEVMVVSAGQNKTVTTEEGLRIVADATIPALSCSLKPGYSMVRKPLHGREARKNSKRLTQRLRSRWIKTSL